MRVLNKAIVHVYIVLWHTGLLVCIRCVVRWTISVRITLLVHHRHYHPSLLQPPTLCRRSDPIDWLVGAPHLVNYNNGYIIVMWWRAAA